MLHYDYIDQASAASLGSRLHCVLTSIAIAESTLSLVGVDPYGYSSRLGRSVYFSNAACLGEEVDDHHCTCQVPTVSALV